MRIDKATCLLISGIIVAICMVGSGVALAQSQSPNNINNSNYTNKSRPQQIHTDQSYKYHSAEMQKNNDARDDRSHNSAWPGGTHTPAVIDGNFQSSGSSGGSKFSNR